MNVNVVLLVIYLANLSFSCLMVTSDSKEIPALASENKARLVDSVLKQSETHWLRVKTKHDSLIAHENKRKAN